jgi:hypothetical protein
MIYSTVFSNNFVSSVANNLTAYYDCNSFAIIYTGPQPTPADFIANWSTTYYIAANTASHTSAANVLVSYGGALHAAEGSYAGGANIVPSGDIVLGVNSNSIYLAQAGTAVYWNNGTAAWAAIFNNGSPPGMPGNPNYDLEGAGLQQASISGSTNFMLCPVSDNAGNGIVQLSNVIVSGSAPTLNAIDIIITL